MTGSIPGKEQRLPLPGRLKNKFEENGEKKIRCDVVANDDSGNPKLRGFFIAAVP
jgi:hypothetical protein